ncbi:hypothetical protein BXZ70DRAFT_317805 [Cristinia sonorae]|uniref:Uncharacterized protein n=1 Tax=Cristinia sonorae TaxID=1940300 RepID=A0A8K0XNB3_9AGAR|nr:hypothetical protein BXZ70DRAFT_317805 [Cristinia sonorae]
MSFGDLFDQPDLYFDTYANIPLQNNTIAMMPNGEADLKYGDDRGAMITGQNAQLASFVGTIGGPQHATSETEHLSHRFHFHPSTEQFTPLSAHTHSSRAEHQAMQTHHSTGIAEASTIPSIPSGQLPRGTPFSRPLRLRPLHPIPDRDAAAPQNIARTRASLQELQHSRRGRQRAMGSSAGFPPVRGAAEMMASTGMERGGQSSDEHRRHGSPQAIPFSIGSPSSATSSEPVETPPVVATPELDVAHHTFTMGNALPVIPDDNVLFNRMEYLPNMLIGPHSSGSCYPTPVSSQTYSGMVDTSATEQWVRALDMSETHCQPVGQRGRHHWHTYGPPQDLGLFLPPVQSPVPQMGDMGGSAYPPPFDGHEFQGYAAAPLPDLSYPQQQQQNPLTPPPQTPQDTHYTTEAFPRLILVASEHMRVLPAGDARTVGRHILTRRHLNVKFRCSLCNREFRCRDAEDHCCAARRT